MILTPLIRDMQSPFASEPHAVGFADVARHHLGRLVPGVLLDAIAGHVARRGRAWIATLGRVMVLGGA